MKHKVSDLAPMQRQLAWAFLALLFLTGSATVDAAFASKLGVQGHGLLGLPPRDVEPLGHDRAAQPHPSPERRAERAEERERLAYAYCLMGGVAVVMSLFYLVNHHSETVRQSTWTALNMTISIFCAVFIFKMIQEFSKALVDVAPHTRIPKFLSVLIFIITYLGMQLTLCLFMNYEKGIGALRGAGVLFSHLSGFAAMFLTAEIQFLPYFRESFWLTTLVALASGLILCILNWVARKVRNMVVLADGRVDEEEELWQDVVADAEKDMLALTMGFGLMQSMRFLITNEAQAFEPDEAPEHITQWDADALLVCSATFALLVALGVWLRERMAHRSEEGSLVRSILEAVPSVASMGMAWSFLFAGEWQVYVMGFPGVRIAGCLVVALLMTATGALLVWLLDFLHAQLEGDNRRIIRELVLALGLLVGFTWERAFDVGLENLCELSGESAWIIRHMLPLVLVVVVLPAWSKYVLPKAIA